MQDWHLYVVRTRDGALYTGVATDVERRIAQHEASAGAKSLRARAPLELVYEARLGSRSLAQRAETRVKRLSKPRKEALVARAPDAPALLALLALDADAVQDSDEEDGEDEAYGARGGDDDDALD